MSESQTTHDDSSPTMTPEREQELLHDLESKLSDLEITQGWHFCPTFDHNLKLFGKNGCLCHVNFVD